MLIGNAAGSTGTATIDGAGTRLDLGFWFVGNSGTGTATVSGGATVDIFTTEAAAANLQVGDSDSGVGTLNISGMGSSVSANKRAEIGGSFNETGGNGTLNVLAGGLLDSDGGRIGARSTAAMGSGGVGVVNVDGNGSAWISHDEIIVGGDGEGHLSITGGGSVIGDANMRVGDLNTNAGAATVTVSGNSGSTPSTLVIANELSVGDDRAATMFVSDGAIVTSGASGSGEGIIGDFPTADGALVAVDNATWNHLGSRIKVGADGGSLSAPSTLRVTNAGTVTSSGAIMVSDDTSQSHGLLEIIGDGASVSAGSFSVIGDAGPGTLNVLDGGLYTVADQLDVSGSGNGTADISGAGSMVTVTHGSMNVGRSDTSVGTLSLSDGGTIITNDFNIARDATSTGTVNVNSGGLLSIRSGSSLYVSGQSGLAGGNANLHVQGGEIDASDGTVVINANGALNLSSGRLKLSALARSAGSQFNFTGGTLSMTGNQVLNAGQLEAIFNENRALNPGMTLEVTGAASLEAPLRLGGGKFSTGMIADVSQLDWDSGTFELTSSSLSVALGGLFGDSLYLNANQQLAVSQDIINDGVIVSGGAITTGATLQNNGDLVLIDTQVNSEVVSPLGSTVTVVGAVNLNGPVTGAADFFGPGTANFNAAYDPGDSPATVAFEGSVALGASNSLAIEIGGVNPGEFDRLVIDGTAMIDGRLDVTLVDVGAGTYSPQLGDSIPFLSASGGFGGLFSELNLPSLGGGLQWQLNPGGSTLFLNVIANVLNGDFDNDGDLDGADVDSLVANLAAMTGDLAFDLTGDGALTEADLEEWLILGGAANLASGTPYLVGDANLDGNVDGQDFVAWNSNKFTATAAWTAGDFNGNGLVDGQDFVAWNTNKFTAADTPLNAVPEPTAGMLCTWLLFALLACRRLTT